MTVPAKFLLKQGPNLVALARAGVTAYRSRGASGGPILAPGPIFSTTIAPPTPDHVAAYVALAGGQPSAYKGVVPAHMFSAWAFAPMSRTLEGLPVDLSRVLNAGVAITQSAPLPARGRWKVTARLSAVRDDDRHTLLTQRITTGPEEAPEALVAEVRVIVPKRKAGKGAPSAPKLVPTPAQGAREIGWWKLPANAGLDHALLSGDFNPIHWIPAAGRASGFKGCILHGFATLSRAVEGFQATVLSGRVDRLRSIEARFVRPVALPGTVGLYVAGNELFVGGGFGAPANLVASFTLSEG